MSFAERHEFADRSQHDFAALVGDASVKGDDVASGLGLDGA